MNTPTFEPTPFVRQYLALKSEAPEGSILLVSMGEFYEMLFDDAIRGSSICGAILTRRGGVPMCGIPRISINTYLARFINAGLTVAIAETMEQPATRRGIIRREIVRIVAPGRIEEVA